MCVCPLYSAFSWWLTNKIEQSTLYSAFFRWLTNKTDRTKHTAFCLLLMVHKQNRTKYAVFCLLLTARKQNWQDKIRGTLPSLDGSQTKQTEQRSYSKLPQTNAISLLLLLIFFGFVFDLVTLLWLLRYYNKNKNSYQTDNSECDVLQ